MLDSLERVYSTSAQANKKRARLPAIMHGPLVSSFSYSVTVTEKTYTIVLILTRNLRTIPSEVLVQTIKIIKCMETFTSQESTPIR